CNPGGATSRLGASALPIARNGSPLDMALLRRDWGRAGRRKKNTNAAATGRVAARGRTACFTPRRQGRNGRSGGSTGIRRCTAAAHSPQKKTSRRGFFRFTHKQPTPQARCARRKDTPIQIDLETGETLEDGSDEELAAWIQRSRATREHQTPSEPQDEPCPF